MQVVTLIRVSLNRVGSAGSTGFASHRRATDTFPIADDRTETVREAVVKLAIKHGELEGNLAQLRRVNDFFQQGDTIIAFDLQTLRASYSTLYAECQVFTALEASGRYYKLEEIKCTGDRI